jgi:hypothetical protein
MLFITQPLRGLPRICTSIIPCNRSQFSNSGILMVRCLFDFMSNGGGFGDDPAAALSGGEKASDTMSPFSLV